MNWDEMAKIKGWKRRKDMDNAWISTEVAFGQANVTIWNPYTYQKNWVVTYKSCGKSEKSMPFKTKEKAMEFAIRFMKSHPYG